MGKIVRTDLYVFVFTKLYLKKSTLKTSKFSKCVAMDSRSLGKQQKVDMNFIVVAISCN